MLPRQPFFGFIWGAHLRHLSNTTELSICGSNAALLWPPCVADADIIFLPCGFFPSSIFFFYSSPNLSGRRLDAYQTSTHGVALVRI